MTHNILNNDFNSPRVSDWSEEAQANFVNSFLTVDSSDTKTSNASASIFLDQTARSSIPTTDFQIPDISTWNVEEDQEVSLMLDSLEQKDKDNDSSLILDQIPRSSPLSNDFSNYEALNEEGEELGRALVNSFLDHTHFQANIGSQSTLDRSCTNSDSSESRKDFYGIESAKSSEKLSSRPLAKSQGLEKLSSEEVLSNLAQPILCNSSLNTPQKSISSNQPLAFSSFSLQSKRKRDITPNKSRNAAEKPAKPLIDPNTLFYFPLNNDVVDHRNLNNKSMVVLSSPSFIPRGDGEGREVSNIEQKWIKLRENWHLQKEIARKESLKEKERTHTRQVQSTEDFPQKRNLIEDSSGFLDQRTSRSSPPRGVFSDYEASMRGGEQQGSGDPGSVFSFSNSLPNIGFFHPTLDQPCRTSASLGFGNGCYYWVDSPKNPEDSASDSLPQSEVSSSKGERSLADLIQPILHHSSSNMSHPSPVARQRGSSSRLSMSGSSNQTDVANTYISQMKQKEKEEEKLTSLKRNSLGLSRSFLIEEGRKSSSDSISNEGRQVLSKLNSETFNENPLALEGKQETNTGQKQPLSSRAAKRKKLTTLRDSYKILSVQRLEEDLDPFDIEQKWKDQEIHINTLDSWELRKEIVGKDSLKGKERTDQEEVQPIEPVLERRNLSKRSLDSKELSPIEFEKKEKSPQSPTKQNQMDLTFLLNNP